jgi:hypothetical protein
MSENTEPYYLLHRIKILESSYNELVGFIDEIFEEIEKLKKKEQKETEVWAELNEKAKIIEKELSGSEEPQVTFESLVKESDDTELIKLCEDFDLFEEDDDK